MSLHAIAKHHVHGSEQFEKGYHSTARIGEGARIVSVCDHEIDPFSSFLSISSDAREEEGEKWTT